jgi:hypothetical protein
MLERLSFSSVETVLKQLRKLPWEVVDAVCTLTQSRVVKQDTTEQLEWFCVRLCLKVARKKVVLVPFLCDVLAGLAKYRSNLITM